MDVMPIGGAVAAPIAGARVGIGADAVPGDFDAQLAALGGRATPDGDGAPAMSPFDGEADAGRLSVAGSLAPKSGVSPAGKGD